MNSGNEYIKKNQYLVIQEAMQEINQLVTQNKFFGTLKINVLKIKENSRKQFLSLTKAKETDYGIDDILTEIESVIDKYYMKQYTNLNSQNHALPSSQALKQIIDIISDPYNEENDEKIDDENYTIYETKNTALSSLISTHNDDNDDDDDNEDKETRKYQLIQTKINAVLDKYPKQLVFNTQKLREITKSNVKLPEILKSLQALSDSPHMQFKSPEKPDYYPLYSKEDANILHDKSLSNILKGNCFFVSLYGQSNSVRNVLKILTKHEKIRDRKADDIISIYGPVDIISFSMNVPHSFEKVKQFNIDLPNIYLFEISNVDTDKNYIKWCNFLSFISHITIFCSEKVPTEEEINHFKNLLFSETKTNSIINCFDIQKLDEDVFRESIFQKFIEKADQFIPHETAGQYLSSIKEKETTSSLKEARTYLEIDKMNDYSVQVLNISREFYQKIIKDMLCDFYSKEKETKFVDNFNINQQEVIDEVVQFYYVHINKKFWNDKQVIDVAQVLITEITRDFEPTFRDQRKIEKVGQLIKSIEESPKTFSSKSIDIFKQIQKTLPNESKELTIPKSENEITEFKKKVELIYQSLVIVAFNDVYIDVSHETIMNKIYLWLQNNPTASDDEYGKFYSDLHQQYLKSENNEIIKKIFCLASHVREVISIYQVKEFDFDIDKESFIPANVHIESAPFVLQMTPSTTCHELYEKVKERFSLETVPFIITWEKENKIGDSKYISDVEVFNNSHPIYKIKSTSFTIRYNIRNNRSTYSFLQSMIFEKEIKKGDDFTIRSSSKESSFNINFPDDRQGWFNVPIDITTSDAEKSFGEDGGVLVYLKMTANEQSFLRNGNCIVHQSFQNGKWVDEDDPVFISYPKCNKAVFLLRHCSKHKLTDLNTNLDVLVPSDKKNKRWSRNWDGMNENRPFNRSGRPYFVPVGYKGEGILVDKFNENTCVGFHGTKAPYVDKIINDGFKIPSQRGGIEKGRIGLNVEYNNIKNWEDAIFVSPSIKYAAYYNDDPIYLVTENHTYVQAGHVYNDYVRIIVLQVRVNPKTIIPYKNSTRVDIVGDHFTNKEMEWRIVDPKDLFSYRLLTKDTFLSIHAKDYKRRKY